MQVKYTVEEGYWFHSGYLRAIINIQCMVLAAIQTIHPSGVQMRHVCGAVMRWEIRSKACETIPISLRVLIVLCMVIIFSHCHGEVLAIQFAELLIGIQITSTFETTQNVFRALNNK